MGLPPRADEIGKKIYNSCDNTQRLKGGDTMKERKKGARNNLYYFRHNLRLSQQEMADKIGCSRAMYSYIEAGTRDGRVKFWENLKTEFNLTDAEKGELMKRD